MSKNSKSSSQIFECSSIQVQTMKNSTFSTNKSGFLRIVKDTLKVSYVLEFCPTIRIKTEALFAKTHLEIPFNKKNLQASNFKKEKITLSFKHGACVVYVQLKNPTERSVLEKIFLDCLEDPELMNDEKIFSNALTNENPEPVSSVKSEHNTKQQTPSRTVLYKADMDSLLNDYRPTVNQVSKKPSACTSLYNEQPRPKPIANTEQSQQNSLISKQRFYSNTNDKENLQKAFEYRTCKRSHSPTAIDENRPCTPKRNCHGKSDVNFDFMPSLSNSWNRTNSMSKSNGKGFSNLGNTCYMNAILQCLLNIDSFSNDLLSKKQYLNENLPYNCLYKTLCQLYNARNMHNEIVQIQALKDVKSAISQEATRFSGYQQHDAHEFLCQVLDQLKEDIDKLKKQLETNKAEDIIDPVISNFEFQVVHFIRCTKCSEVITKNEGFNNLCLEIPNLKILDHNVSVQNSLELFFDDENVSFNCERCKNDRVIIHHKFKQLPRVLILYLKRYQLDNGDLVKNECNIDIEKYLTLNWLCDDKDVELPKKPLYENLSEKLEVQTNSQVQIAKSKPLANREFNKQNNPNKTGLTFLMEPPSSPLLNRSMNLAKTPTTKQNKPININNQENPSVDTNLPIELHKTCVYDKNTYALANMSEDEQINMALKLSMESKPGDDTMQDICSKKMGFKNKSFAEIDLNVENDGMHNNKMVYFVDGANDIIDTSIEHEVNDNGFQKLFDDEINEDFNRRKVCATFAHRNKNICEPSKSRRNQNDLNQIIFKIKSSESLENFAEVKFEADDELSTDNKLPTQYCNTAAKNDTSESETKKENSNSIESPPSFIKLNRTKDQDSMIIENSITGTQPNSYRIVGIVSHLGGSSSSGHYICDVYNRITNKWSSYDDKKVEILDENEVLEKRSKTAYIFFYVHNLMLPDPVV